MLGQKAMQVVSQLLIQYDIEIDLCKDANGVVYADLNSRTKSYLHLYETEDGSLVVKQRYERDTTLEAGTLGQIMHQLAVLYSQGIYGRSFGNECWDNLCQDFGVEVKYGDL